ncbi:AlbA family DNA-binding domain-containing protein [Nocardia paucivorans]|uniref:AlbA family DNA-binding domain-containing protein n=1 Tax=Nocardia paucivorans TaxID=114259 RepID=UPI0002F00353|nr:ATP-binding protein [Nocardia paucivorans]
MAVVVEPVVTQEKLRSLLAEKCEQSALDYKSELDLSERGHLVEFAKDIAAMQAESDGGYIVVGADDHGTPVAGLTERHLKLFDETVLRTKLERYITDVVVQSAVHLIDGVPVVLIHIAPAAAGWAIFCADGAYQKPGSKDTVTKFMVGDVFVRHGTSSERWNDKDRERLLEREVTRRKEAWRSELTAEFTAQFQTVRTVAGLADQPSTAVTWRLDTHDFEELATELLRRDDDIPLRRFLSTATQDAATLLDGDPTEVQHLLDNVTILAALAIHHHRDIWLTEVVAAFERLYEMPFTEYGPEPTAAAEVLVWVDIVTRLYALGALAVRTRAWAAVRALVDGRPSGVLYRVFGTWLRHGSTMAARARIFEKEHTELLARAHNTIRGVNALHPDRPVEDASILNSLCQFDAYAAMIVIGMNSVIDKRNFYTNFAAYDARRTEPAFRAMVSDPSVRTMLFDGDDRLLADAITAISVLADKEDSRYFGWSGINDPAVEDFVARNGSPR